MAHLSRWTALRRVALRNHRGSLASTATATITSSSTSVTTTASPLVSGAATGTATGTISATVNAAPLPLVRLSFFSTDRYPPMRLGSPSMMAATANKGGFPSRSRSDTSSIHYRVGESISCFSTTTDSDGDNNNSNNKNNNDKDDESNVQEAETEPSSPPPLKNKKSMEFQAETKQLLDIVTHSLYTDKEVFLRELISNASDACEKLRHLQSFSDSNANLTFIDKERPLEIHIDLDEVESSLTIRDTGIGMTSDDIVSNLGTIARSGSKQFMNQLEQARAESKDDTGALDAAKGIIGKFGVGFYSAFMVADSVTVTSKPATVTEGDDSTVSLWNSEGIGSYELGEIDDSEESGNAQRYDRGTTVKLFLKEEYWGLLSEIKIKDVLNKYSNFVRFPIYVNGDRVNTVEAVWARDPREVDEETYSEFYKYIANAIDEPLDTIHFRADAPLELRALLFVPSFHSEKYGMERMEPGVSLYSRKVLIEHKSPDILPDWMRFVKGVVDSEDLPLSISREKPQDTALVGKLKKALTRRFLSQLEKMAKCVYFCFLFINVSRT
mmetsp:Transcript_19156/g.40301  ORF Transcript_19156/g.40301 Transcript_19156/m.40301 type:complete len:555 (-) Transcript_19156:1491-3155(-)